MIPAALAAGVAASLERGAWRGPVARALSSLWAAEAAPVRPLALPDGAVVVGVGGPTLGGSHKTPLVVALARDLAAAGRPVAVVCHAHGARGGAVTGARLVDPARDAPADVGDDALHTARALTGTPVVVGERARAVALAARLAPLVIVDGLLQAAPRRLSLSILAADAGAPWGAGACPPAGDLRAPRRALLAAADLVVLVDDAPSGPASREPPPGEVPVGRPCVRVAASLSVSGPSGDVPPSALGARRVGVVLAVARPSRVLASLARAGVVPVEVRTFPDHSVPRERRLAGPTVDAWLTTEKCATKLGDRFEGAPLRVLRRDLKVPPALLSAIPTAAP